MTTISYLIKDVYSHVTQQPYFKVTIGCFLVVWFKLLVWVKTPKKWFLEETHHKKIYFAVFCILIIHLYTDLKKKNIKKLTLKHRISQTFSHTLMVCMRKGRMLLSKRRVWWSAQLACSWTQYLCSGDRFPHQIQTKPRWLRISLIWEQG